MMNEAAKYLIHSLRNDQHTRNHFRMAVWISRCGTFGCIAGTTLLQNAHFKDLIEQDIFAGFHDTEAAKILEIDYHLAHQIFLPELWVKTLIADDHTAFGIGTNEGASLDTIEKMKTWAINITDFDFAYGSCTRFYYKIGPDEAASCLENHLEIHPGYVDWAEAIEPDYKELV